MGVRGVGGVRGGGMCVDSLNNGIDFVSDPWRGQRGRQRGQGSQGRGVCVWIA